LLFLFTIQMFAQNSKEVEKIVKMYNDGKSQKAIEKMQIIVDNEPTDDNWEILIKMKFYRYQNALSSNSKNTDEQAADKQLSSVSVSIFYHDFISTCKKASRETNNSIASQYLRNFIVDHTVDTAISDVAYNEYSTAENYFAQKNYQKAIEFYQRAINLQPNFYRATIYLGDCYWYLQNYDKAIYYFERGIKMYPELLEPRKYLVDALMDKGDYDKALTACIDAIIVYPDAAMFNKLAIIASKTNNNFDLHWMPRTYELNISGTAQPTLSGDLQIYREAKQHVAQNCDSLGIITNSQVTTTQYLELYSWEKMLELMSAPQYDFAHQMQRAGFLDCYVFISLYHIDIYPQFKHFAANNPEKIKKYITAILMQ